MYDKAREARPKKLEKLRSAWAERAQNLRLQLRFWEKKYHRAGPRPPFVRWEIRPWP